MLIFIIVLDIDTSTEENNFNENIGSDPFNSEKSKKRKKGDSSNWRRNKIKKLRNSGQKYVN